MFGWQTFLRAVREKTSVSAASKRASGWFQTFVPGAIAGFATLALASTIVSRLPSAMIAMLKHIEHINVLISGKRLLLDLRVTLEDDSDERFPSDDNSEKTNGEVMEGKEAVPPSI